MRCHAEAPTAWPSDQAWQVAWRALIAPLATSAVGPDNHVNLPWPDPVRLAAGTHLAPGATYRIAEDQLRTGVLEARVEAAAREVHLTWSPITEPGQGEVIIAGLDHPEQVRCTASLDHLQLELIMAPRRSELTRLRVRLDWLVVELDAQVASSPDGDRLRVDLDVRGVGLWRPTLAPVLAAMEEQISQELVDAVQEVARILTLLPDVAPDEPPLPGDPVRRIWIGTPAQGRAKINHGMEEIGRRLRIVADRMMVLPWWRRTAHRWRRELATLPPARWPHDGVLTVGTWADVEREAVRRTVPRVPWRRGEDLDTVIATLLDEHLENRRQQDRALRRLMGPGQDLPTQTLLSDENFDTRWLATPVSAIRRSMNLASDAEAQQRFTEILRAAELSTPSRD